MPDTSQVSLLPMLLTGGVGGMVSAGCLWAYSVFSPRCQFWAPVVRWLPQREAVALTFDDGPHAEFTPQVLDILGEQGVRASFFVIGQFARQNPGLVRRIYAAGHTLGNHSLDHEHFGVNRNRAYWDRQLKQTQQVVADITGSAPMLFRPPMGFKTRHIAGAAGALGLAIIGWSVRGLDTRPQGDLTGRVLERTTGHDIVVLHDGVEPARRARGGSQRQTVEALPGILAGIREKKLRCVSLMESLSAGVER